MLHSIYHHKSTNEDPKTSSVFETILMLPDEMVWSIIRNACFDNSNLPVFAGQIESFHFWPHWNAKDIDDITNTNFVEPDVFLRFQGLDVIIEAKYGEVGGQYRQQWKNELIAYMNEFGNHNNVHFIAVGGNADKNNDSIFLNEKSIIVNKCSWLSLLIQISKIKDDLLSSTFRSTYNSYILRQLNMIELAFNINGVYNIKWFNDLRKTKTQISPDSIVTIKNFFVK